LSLAVKNNNVKLVQFLCIDEYASSLCLREKGSWLDWSVPAYEAPIAQHFFMRVDVISLARCSARAIWTHVSQLDRTRRANVTTLAWCQYYEMSKLEFEKSNDWSSDVRYMNIAVIGEYKVGKSSIINVLRDESEERPVAVVGMDEWILQRVKHYKRTVQGKPKVEIRLFGLQGFSGTDCKQVEEYLTRFGVVCFDNVLIVTAGKLWLDEWLVSFAASLSHLKTTWALAMNKSCPYSTGTSKTTTETVGRSCKTL